MVQSTSWVIHHPDPGVTTVLAEHHVVNCVTPVSVVVPREFDALELMLTPELLPKPPQEQAHEAEAEHHEHE